MAKWPSSLAPFQSKIEKAARPCVFLVPKILGKKRLDPSASNLCGLPYLLKDEDVPRISKEPFFLVCQINFDEMPALAPFPKKGILQFWVCDHGHDRGIVRFHPKPIADAKKLTTIDEYKEKTGPWDNFDGFFEEEDHVQGFRPCSIKFEKGISPVSGFDRDGHALLKELFGEDDALDDAYMDFDGSWPKHEHWLGGFTHHGQGDPRERNKTYRSYVPLLHLGTDEVGDHNNICWGDAGDASFFWDPSKKDFSKIFYHWDN